MKNWSTTQKVLAVAGVIIVILVIYNWKKIFGNGSTSGASERLTSLSPINNSESAILKDLQSKLSKFGASNLNQMSPADRVLAIGYVNDANGKLSAIGSKVKISIPPTSSKGVYALQKSCNNLCEGRACSGAWGSGIFGFCICFGCGSAE